jgi:monoterpene epsilon-lactone hydrolase
LAPEHPYPAPVEDAMRAYLWMLDGGTDPRRIVLAGDSTGAGLALSLIITLKQQALPLPGGAVLLCPGIDFTGETIRPRAGEDIEFMRDQIRRIAAAYLGGQPIDDPVISPLHADLTGLPPMLIQGGTGDYHVEDAHRLADHARRHGVDVRLKLYPVETHVFQIFWSFLPEAADAIRQAGRFVVETQAGGADAEAARSS